MFYRNVFLSLLLCATTIANAQPVQSDIETKNVRIEDGSNRDERRKADRKSLSDMWGLTAKEWDRYELLKRGPRGIWSPVLDPIETLLIEARSDDERRYYAEKYVLLWHEKTQKEMDAEWARLEASNRLFGQEPLLDLARVKMILQGRQRTSIAQPGPGDRVMFFTRLDCAECDASVSSLIKYARTNTSQGVDIYFLDASAGNSADIFKWAAKSGITPDLVKSKRITLNSDGGTLKSLTHQERVPAYLVRRADNQIELIPGSYLSADAQ